ncbi:DNA cross-link repair 1A protein-like isoform X2 [Battus philenor]
MHILGENVKQFKVRRELDFAQQIVVSDMEDLNSYNKHLPSEVIEIDISSDSQETFKIAEIDISNADVKPIVSLSFNVKDSNNINVKGKNTNIKDFSVFHENNDTDITCKLIEGSELSSESVVENMNAKNQPTTQKEQAVNVNLEIKRKKYLAADYSTEETNILFLKTNAIEKLSHVIVQPPNYKFVKRKVPFRDKFKTHVENFCVSGLNNGKVSECGGNLKQTSIDDYLCRKPDVHSPSAKTGIIEQIYDRLQNVKPLMPDDVEAMNKNSGVNNIVVKCDKIKASYKALTENDMLSKQKLYSPKRDVISLRQQDIKASSSEVPRSSSPGIRNSSISSYSPRKNADSLHFSLPSKSKSNKNTVSPRKVPFYKIVAGTHFAVDAFSYGEIPNVNNYFLTHFHSDHYSGLKRTFSKTLFCTKVTADLCISRLGVNPKYITIINIDEIIKIEGVEVTAVDANHCPGAIMLVFTLPNGKTLLHTGDFRASPLMESYPVFWNKEMHTIYLDTTYCNPRYDFPTQDQCLEMAFQLLREKKNRLEEVGKKFSSVLIVCGTYTIGKEKFFLGIARRVGCSVWACPEKDRVLQIVEGRSFGRSPPHSCQLHVVPMRDLTHDKLRAYLESLQGAFSEVVAFKPSGWENGKSSPVQKDSVTIHGIPYSEHSSFSEMIRFVKYLKPKQVVPTVDIAGGVKTVQQFFPCPLVYNEDMNCQNKMTDYFSVQSRQQVHAVS